MPASLIFHKADAFPFHGFGDNYSGLALTGFGLRKGFLQALEIMTIGSGYRKAKGAEFIVNGCKASYFCYIAINL